jgi:hypothetical protein
MPMGHLLEAIHAESLWSVMENGRATETEMHLHTGLITGSTAKNRTGNFGK